MLPTVEAVRFIRRMGSGKTKPLLLACTAPDGQEIEIIVKISSSMERGIVGLIAEAIAGMLARDLGLPIPQSYLIHLDQGFITSVPDAAVRASPQKCCSMTFGSERLPDGYSVVTSTQPIPPELMPQAGEIFAFDLLVQNADRLISNPNCLTNGTQFAIYDHEVAFIPALFAPPPWTPNGLEYAKKGATHLFFDRLRGKEVALERFLTALQGLSGEQCDAYLASLPEDWKDKAAEAESMVDTSAS